MTKRVVSLSIVKPGAICPRGRKAIVKWLREVADHFEANGDDYPVNRTMKIEFNIWSGNERPV